MKKPLEGVKVIDFSTYAAAPYCGRLLADMGADVIKVESPNGDQHRTFGFFVHTVCEPDENPCYLVENAGKRNICINMRTDEGKKVMKDLLKDANILFTNNRMQALKAMGMSYEDLKDEFPHLIYGHISGYGLKGPDANTPGYDSTAYFGRVGDLIDMAYDGYGPCSLIYGVGDNTTGTALALGLVSALHKQQLTGEGDYVLVSLYGTAIAIHGLTLVTAQEGEGYNEVYPKDKFLPPTPVVNTYATKDGAINISALKHDKMWPKFCDAIGGLDDVKNDPRYTVREIAALPENNRPLTKRLEAMFKSETTEYWEKKLETADIPFSACRHYKDVMTDEQAWVNGYLVEHTFENGNKSIIPATPVQFGENKSEPIKPAPKAGNDTDDVLKEIGYTDAMIAELKAKNAIYQLEK